MALINNITQLKTTFVGLVLFAVCLLDLWYFEKLTVTDLWVLAGVGVLFVFAPDKILDFIYKKVE